MKKPRIHNALVLYHSKTGGTRKLALKIAEGLGADVLELEKLADVPLEKLDLLVLGSPVHGDLPSDPVKAFLAEERPLPRVAAVFCAHAADEHFLFSPEACLKAMTEALEKRGTNVVASFRARSENSDPALLEWLRINMIERYPGAVSSKGHPDIGELKSAYAWGRSLKDLLGRTP